MPAAERQRRTDVSEKSPPLDSIQAEEPTPQMGFVTRDSIPPVLGPFREPTPSASDLAYGRPRPQSVAGHDVAFAFDPAAVSFDGEGSRRITLRNATNTPQTLDRWDLEGDHSFQTDGLGVQCEAIRPGEARSFDVRFAPDSELPQAAALIVRSASPHDPSRIELAGIAHGRLTPGAMCDGGVPISAVTSEGRPNSLQSAFMSVQGALTAVMARQADGVQQIHALAVKDIPAQPPGWDALLNAIIAQGLLGAIGAIGAYLGGGLALAAYDALTARGLRPEAASAAQQIAKLTVAVHEGLVHSLTRGVSANAVSGVRESIERSKQKPEVTSVIREAFFDAHATTLGLAFQDAVTSVNNHEGDYAALEARNPGLGFAALEAYRSHLYCQSAGIVAIQANRTLGAWAALLARTELGTHVPEKWEHATEGTELSSALRSSKNGKQELRDLAKGVLELHVVWDADRARRGAVYELHEARMRGMHADLAKLLTRDSLSAFPLPIVAHGLLRHQAPDPRQAYTGELRVARNEGGAVTFEVKDTAGETLLTTLGDGDAFEGSRALFRSIDDLVIPDDKLKGG